MQQLCAQVLCISCNSSCILNMGAVFKFRGRHAGAALEHPGKVLGIFKGQHCGNLRKVHIRFPDKLFCPVNFSFGRVRGNGFAGFR